MSVRTHTLSGSRTHAVSGVAEDLPRWLVDRHVQHGGAVAPQGSYGARVDERAPEPERSVAASGDQQLQSRAVVEALGSLEQDEKRGPAESTGGPFWISAARLSALLMFSRADGGLKICVFVLKTAIVTNGRQQRPF